MTEMIIGGRLTENDTSRLARNDGRYRTARIDGTTHALVYVSYEHHESHAGHHFTAYRTATLSSANTASVALTTPAGDERMHVLFHANTSDAGMFTVTEGGVLAGGTAFSPINSRRNRQGVAGFISVATCLVGNTGATPITMAGGSIIFQQVLTAGNKTGGVTQREEEYILKPATSYLFQVLSSANGNAVTVILEWYEHENLN